MEEIKKSAKKLIIAGGSVVTVALLGILIYKTKNRSKAKLPSQQSTVKIPEEVLRSFSKEKGQQEQENNLSQQKTNQVEKNLAEDFEVSQYVQESDKDKIIELLQELIGKQKLSLEDIGQIEEKAPQIIKDEFITLTQNNRQERRKFDFQDQKYFDIVIDYNIAIEDLLKKAEVELLTALKISADTFQNCLKELINTNEESAQTVYLLQAGMRQKIKEFIPSSKQITLQKVKEILKFQLKLLTDKSSIFEPIMKKLLSRGIDYYQLIPQVITVVLQDYSYEEFSVEEEVLFKSFGEEIQNDLEIMNIFKEMQGAMDQLMMLSQFA